MIYEDTVKNPNAALQTTVEDWIESYQEASGPALAELINFVLRVRRFATYIRQTYSRKCPNRVADVTLRWMNIKPKTTTVSSMS